MLARAAAGTGHEGDWLIARHQTAGRGRLGRVWAGQAGNFHGSTIVTLRPDDAAAPTLALVAALATHATIVDLTRGHCAPTIKWPNDLLIGPAKLAGILLERSGQAIVIGIGVNLAWAPDLPDRATTCLAAHGQIVSPETLLTALAPVLAEQLHRWRTEPLPDLLAKWTSRAHPVGTPLTVSDGPDAALTGAFDGLDDTGALRLRLQGGETRHIHAGEISLAIVP